MFGGALGVLRVGGALVHVGTSVGDLDVGE